MGADKPRLGVVLSVCGATVVCVMFLNSLSLDAGGGFVSNPLHYMVFQQANFTPAILDNSSRCPNLDRSALRGSRQVKNEKMAILIAVMSADNYADYKPAIDSLQCYADHYGYHLELLNMSSTAGGVGALCDQSDVFFKRHCFVADWMDKFQDRYEYILYLDADMGVINPCHVLQEYIDPNPEVQIAFYDRYYDYEVAAGSYFARNSEYSRMFIKFWADYFYRLPKSFHGTDNGALHQVLMELNFDETPDRMQCYDLWNKSQNFDDLFTYQICTRFALGDGTYFCKDRVKILRKGAPGFWVRDGWLTKTLFGPSDFMFHGWKKSKLNGEWTWPFMATTFDLAKCLPGSPLDNFAVTPSYSYRDEDIMAMLNQKKREVHANYVAVLQKLGKLCDDKQPPPKGQPCPSKTTATATGSGARVN